MNVLLVGRELAFPFGTAAASLVRRLTRGLHDTGADVHVLVMDFTERRKPFANFEGQGQWKGVRFTYATGTPILPRNPLETALRRWSASREPWKTLERAMAGTAPLDAVLYYGADPDELGALARRTRRLNVPVIPIVVEWYLGFGHRTETQHRADHRFWQELGSTDGVVVISEFLESRVRATHPHLPVLRVPVLTDQDDWSDVVPSQRGGPYAVFCADFDSYPEDALFVLQALSNLEDVSFELVLSGKASPATALRLHEAARSLPASMRFTLLRDFLPDPDLRSLLCGAAALLAPLDSTPRSLARFPQKVADYLSTGVPVVSCNVGEIGAYLDDGLNAYLARPSDPRAFADKLRQALSAKDRAAVGTRGKLVAETVLCHGAQGPRLRHFLEGVPKPRCTPLSVGRAPEPSIVPTAAAASERGSPPRRAGTPTSPRRPKSKDDGRGPISGREPVPGPGRDL